MLTGLVKWWNDAKGYGFAVVGETDYFIHYSEIRMPGHTFLRERQIVTFAPVEGPKGWQAVAVIPGPIAAAAP